MQFCQKLVCNLESFACTTKCTLIWWLWFVFKVKYVCSLIFDPTDFGYHHIYCQWFIDERIEGQLHDFNKHKASIKHDCSSKRFELAIWNPNSNFQNSKLKLLRTFFEHLVNPANSKLLVQSNETFANIEPLTIQTSKPDQKTQKKKNRSPETHKTQTKNHWPTPQNP